MNGKNLPLVKAEIETLMDEAGGPKSIRMWLNDKEGRTHFVEASIVKAARLPFPSRDGKVVSILHESLARYRYAGLTGYGIAEYLIRS